MCHIPTTSTESTWSTKSLFAKYREIWERERKAEGRTVACLEKLQEFGCYFWKLEALHTNGTPPFALEMPCNEYIIEATYMSIATGLLKNPKKREKKKEKAVKTVI